MNFGGHLMTGWTIANASGVDSKQRRFVTLMAVIPDIDGFAILIPSLFEKWHRTFGHNVFFGIFAPLSALIFFRKKSRKTPLLLGYLAILSHYLLDLFVTGWWAFYPLWPVSDQMILMSLYIPEPVMKYHIQISLFIVLLTITFGIYWKFERTPIEALSARLDRFLMFFATAPFRKRCEICSSRAFYQCERCGKSVCGNHVRVRRWWRTGCTDCDDLSLR